MSKEQRTAVDAQLRTAAFDASRAPAELREAFAAMMAGGPPPSGVTLTPAVLGGRPALEITPEGGAADGTILYFHGGAWVVGSPATARQLTAALVLRSGARAVSLDYRLAPEHPFPAAIEDAVAAYRDLLEQGIPAEQVVLAGDSAGGGLAVAALLAAREAGLPLPAGAVAFSPILDATLSGESMTAKEGTDPTFTRESLERLGAHYLAGQDPHQPLASPAVYADLRGLPPLLLQAGSNEVLLDDSTRLATRAAAADVDVILDVTADVPHVFQSFAGWLDEADAALDRAARFILDRLASVPGRALTARRQPTQTPVLADQTQPRNLPEALIGLLRGASLCFISTVMPDGSPQLTQTWADTDGTHILINTAEGFQKVRNIRRDPRVAVAIADPDKPMLYYSVRGEVSSVSTDSAADHVEELSHRYFGQPFPWPNGRDETRLILTINAHKIYTPMG